MDVRAYELRSAGIPLKLKPIPMELLLFLVERRGEMVTREQIVERIWGKGVFLDTDNGINGAISKIRQVLRDDAEQPRFVQTVTGKGYRFVASVIEVPFTAPKKDEAPSQSSIGLTTSDAKAAEVPGAFRRKLWKILVPAVLAVAVGVISVALSHRSVKANRLGDKDTIVLADFANSTGDAVFDDTLKTALNVSLRQSPFLNVLPDGQVAKTLNLMVRSADAKLTPEIARELCLRTGSKAYLAGAIGSLGSEYVLGLKAMNCRSGAMLAEEQVTAASKEKVLDALGEAASKLRTELGESLATVQKFDVPLEQATTSSLDALKAYSLGAKAVNEQGSAAAVLFYQRAIELDPNFAMAYAEVGGYYYELGEQVRASEYYTKAFQLREHASEREKLEITAYYYQNVTGELDKAAQTYQQEINSYPGSAYINLGDVYSDQGQYEKAAEMARQSVRLAPDLVASHIDLANYVLALQRSDEARQMIHEAQARKIDPILFHPALYALAFFGSDGAGMAEQQQWFAGRPEENFGLALASDTEAYGGHLGKARELTKRAVDAAIRADDKENAAVWQAIAAQREAAYGNNPEARQLAAEALKLAPASQGVESEAALAFALAGDTARAESLAQDLGKLFPLNTQTPGTLAPCDSGAVGDRQKEPECRHSFAAECFIHRVGADYVRPQHFLPLSDVCARRGIPGDRTGHCRYRRIPEDSRPQRDRVELLDGIVSASGSGSCPCVGVEKPASPKRGCRCCPHPCARCLQRFSHPLERRRPRYPHPQGSESGVREAAVAVLVPEYFQDFDLVQQFI